jgi:hypothetical protein
LSNKCRLGAIEGSNVGNHARFLSIKFPDSTRYAADAACPIEDEAGKALGALIIEIQLSSDELKPPSWPSYTASVSLVAPRWSSHGCVDDHAQSRCPQARQGGGKGGPTNGRPAGARFVLAMLPARLWATVVSGQSSSLPGAGHELAHFS